MPVFDWQASSVSEMTGRHFWIWWAVMIPLSVVTLATVVLWGRLRAKRGEILILGAIDMWSKQVTY